MLRKHFLFDRSRYGELSRVAYAATREFFKDERSASAVITVEEAALLSATQLCQAPLDFHENGSNYSWPQSGQRILRKPKCKSPQRRKLFVVDRKAARFPLRSRFAELLAENCLFNCGVRIEEVSTQNLVFWQIEQPQCSKIPTACQERQQGR